MELLRDMIPGATRIALLVNPNNPGTPTVIEGSEGAARRLGQEIVVLKAGAESEIESAVAAAVQQKVSALIVASDAYLNSRSRLMAFLALRHGLPTVYQYARERRFRHIDKVMAPIRRIVIGRLASMLAASSKARSRPICRCCNHQVRVVHQPDDSEGNRA